MGKRQVGICSAKLAGAPLDVYLDHDNPSPFISAVYLDIKALNFSFYLRAYDHDEHGRIHVECLTYLTRVQNIRFFCILTCNLQAVNRRIHVSCWVILMCLSLA